MLYIKYVYVLGGGKRLFGSFPRKFRDDIVQIVQICTFGLSIRENVFAFTFKVVFTYALCLCQSDSASVLWYFYIQRQGLYIKGNTCNRRKTYLIIGTYPIYGLEL